MKDIRSKVYGWLGFWRDKIPDAAVAQLQNLLGPLESELLGNGMHDPIVDMCDAGHKYYKEDGVHTRCPFCLSAGLEQARTEIKEITKMCENIIKKKDA